MEKFDKKSTQIFYIKAGKYLMCIFKKVINIKSLFNMFTEKYMNIIENFKKIFFLRKQIEKSSDFELFKGCAVVISKKRKFIYFGIAKTGSSSIKHFFKTFLGLRFNNMNKRQLKEEIIKNPKYFKFSFVRNPWDRIVSCYFNKVKSDKNYNESYFINGVAYNFKKYPEIKAGMSFESFVKVVSKIPDDGVCDDHISSQFMQIYNKENECLVDFIGRFESLEEDFKKIMDKLKIKKMNLQHINKNKDRKHYSEYYTEETRELIAQRYKKDIELFGYKFEDKKIVKS